jgi:hypothetical protein
MTKNLKNSKEFKTGQQKPTMALFRMSLFHPITPLGKEFLLKATPAVEENALSTKIVFSLKREKKLKMQKSSSQTTACFLQISISAPKLKKGDFCPTTEELLSTRHTASKMWPQNFLPTGSLIFKCSESWGALVQTLQESSQYLKISS